MHTHLPTHLSTYLSTYLPAHVVAGSVIGPAARILLTHILRDDGRGLSPWGYGLVVLAGLIGVCLLMAAVSLLSAKVQISSLTNQLRRERHAARHDPLTGLPNRRIVEHLLQSRPGPAAVGLLDLNHFKAVNDHGGHALGDQLLQLTAARLTAGMAADGVVARLAGDEFVLLWDRLPADPPASAAALLRSLEQPVDIAGRRFRLTASLGLSLRTLTLTGTDLLTAADAAMYTAKRDRTGIHIFTPDSIAADGTGSDASSDITGSSRPGELAEFGTATGHATTSTPDSSPRQLAGPAGESGSDQAVSHCPGGPDSPGGIDRRAPGRRPGRRRFRDTPDAR